MNVVGKPQGPAQTVDFDRFRLRRFVESLPQDDELQTVSEAVDLADVAAMLEGNPKAVLLRAVGPEHQELVGNVTGSSSYQCRGESVVGTSNPKPH